jgi:hypothetical protein
LECGAPPRSTSFVAPKVSPNLTRIFISLAFSGPSLPSRMACSTSVSSIFDDALSAVALALEAPVNVAV